MNPAYPFNHMSSLSILFSIANAAKPEQKA
jgi:hypothetical protein